MPPFVVSIDQGTTGTKAYRLYSSGAFTPICSKQHTQLLSNSYVEHNPAEILEHVIECLSLACTSDCVGVGFDGQGETCVAFDKSTGATFYNAIVWQDARTQKQIDALKAAGHEPMVRERSGLVLDPYFSASKLSWLLENVPAAAAAETVGNLCLCTLDSYIIFKLTGKYVTDPSTASRTSLMNIETLTWDAELCDLFNVPLSTLPAIVPTTAGVESYGTFTTKNLTIPIVASVVDQTAALYGHNCRAAGQCKVTFGTGAFVLACTGVSPPAPPPGLLGVAAWQIKGEECVYALDGGVYNAASAVNWLRDTGVFTKYEELDDVFEGDAEDTTSVLLSQGLAFVPALSGLSCPYYDRDAAGTFLGLRLGTSPPMICRAVLEGVALRTEQVVRAVGSGGGGEVSVDGGMACNGGFLQFFAEVTGKRVGVPKCVDVTALGTAQLAALGAGMAVAGEGEGEAKTWHEPGVKKREGAAETRRRFEEAVELSREWGKKCSAARKGSN